MFFITPFCKGFNLTSFISIHMVLNIWLLEFGEDCPFMEAWQSDLSYQVCHLRMYFMIMNRMTETFQSMIIHHSHCLHIGITNRTSYKFESIFF